MSAATIGRLRALPEELRAERRWVVWRLEQRDGKPTKVPYRADGGHASSTDPATWSTFEQALDTVAADEADGVGFVLGDGWVGIDLDGVLNDNGVGVADGFPMPDALTWVTRLGSYTERSPSGVGLHVVGRGELPDWAGNRKGPIEVYGSGRFFTVTGNTLAGLDTVRELELLPDFLEAAGLRRPEPATNGSGPACVPVDLDDRELLDRAYSARNGADFRDLWKGRWEGRHGSQSEADLALCSRLAFWTGRDPARIDRLFRSSGLYRDKWERVDYRERTIEKAIAGCGGVYESRPADARADSEIAAGIARAKSRKDATTAAQRYEFAPLDAFLEHPFPRAEPLLGNPGQIFLAVGSLLLVYGADGAAKTTWTVDGIAHLAAGHDWLGIPVPRPVRYCVIENEGPPALFQDKLADKAKTWDGPAWTHNVFVYQRPWGEFSFAEPNARAALNSFCDEHAIDVVCANPTLGLGVAASGRPDETGRFMDWLVECGLRNNRAFWLLHHENKAGQISGDWGRHPDTKVQLQAGGKQPRTKLVWEKTRWATLPTDEQPKACVLEWIIDTKGYRVVDIDGAGASDSELEQRIDAYLTANPLSSTTTIETQVQGTASRIRKLLESDKYDYVAGPRGAKLWLLATDPVATADEVTTE